MSNKGRSNSIERTLRLPLLSDLAIPEDDCDADSFGLEAKLGSLVDAVLLKETETPFSVMLSGGWGAGKTSAMRWLAARFHKGGDDFPEGQSVQVDTCWFYPWKYQNREDVWRGLVAEVILAAVSTKDVDASKVIKAARQFGGFLGRGFVRILSSVKVKVGDQKTTGVAADLDLKEALGGVIEEYGKHITPQEGYFNEFEKVLESWVEGAYPKMGGRRLVVFIDDLDRCLPDIALQVLEALKLYLNVPNLVFVVGVDRAVIDRIVNKRYVDLVGKEAMDAGFGAKAARYLDKMFPVEVNVEPTDQEVAAFFTKKIEPSGVWKAVPSEHREMLRRVLLDLGGRTPRTIVRLVNRVVVACGRRSAEGSLTLAQELQRELLDVVCQEAGFEDLPQRSGAGRRFFSEWSRILSENPGKALYLPPGELTIRLEAGSETAGRDGGRSHREDEDSAGLHHEDRQVGLAPRREFDHLAPLLDSEYASYRRLLTNLQAALLLEIVYPSLEPVVSGKLALSMSNDTLDRLREIVAGATGRDPDSLTIEDIENTKQLTLFRSSIADISPLALLKQLTELNIGRTMVSDLTPLSDLQLLEVLEVDGTGVSDIAPLTRLYKLQYLNLRYTAVSDLTPISGLISLLGLDLEGTPISDISPLSGLTSLSALYLGRTQVSDLSMLVELKNLTFVRLPDGTKWYPWEEALPSKYCGRPS